MTNRSTNRSALALAFATGYVVGSTRKLRLPLGAAGAVVSRRLGVDPARLGEQLKEKAPGLAGTTDRLRENAKRVGRAATGAPTSPLSGASVEGMRERLGDALRRKDDDADGEASADPDTDGSEDAPAGTDTAGSQDGGKGTGRAGAGNGTAAGRSRRAPGGSKAAGAAGKTTGKTAGKTAGKATGKTASGRAPARKSSSGPAGTTSSRKASSARKTTGGTAGRTAGTAKKTTGGNGRGGRAGGDRRD
ncbi:hypothetical protein F0L17_04430 [Streptomyces sp. TRM43335]|uniref:DNA primase n=1 Tax=Streptomyces taklimakanensis TaxID=2569853 RepID=A0A6G2B7Z3_9ACTN|nr:hypothetical protein [Streptomyces taklimakanensis]MTE18387.1 hypothetical protein [Streptomyces taklimakanensis]